MRFISVDNEKDNFKKRNLECLKYYENEVLPKLDRKILNKLYSESYELKNTPNYASNEYPLELYEKYKDYLDKTRNDTLLFFAEKKFLSWYQKVTRFNRYLFFRSGDKKNVKKIICRFHKKYATMVKNRMNWLMFQYGNENACSVTLTLNPSNFHNDKMCMWETITILVNEFVTELRKYYKDRGLAFPKYIRCIESMKGQKLNDFVGRGNPHIHFCFFGVKYIPKTVIDKFWPYGFNFVNSTAKNQKVRYPIHYVTKYVTKTYTDNDPDNALNQSLVWFFNKNSFDHTKGLVYPLYKPGSGEWICEWLILLPPLGNMFLEMDLIFMAEENLYKIPPPSFSV